MPSDAVATREPGLRWRLAALFLLVLGAISLLAVSVVMLLVGYAEKRVADSTYKIEFVRGTGAGCDGSHGLYLRVADGEPLSCQQSGVAGGIAADLPGFSDEQVAEVIALAKQLGADAPVGLSAADQLFVQGRLDGILATVPAADRKYGDRSIAGAGRIRIGVGLALLGLLGLLVSWRLMRSDWI